MKVLIVGEHVLLLQGLVRLLDEHTQFDIRTTANLEEAHHLIESWAPAVVVVAAMSETSGLLLRNLDAAAAAAPRMVIGPDDRDHFLAALQAGARGFVGSDASAHDLIGCINAVARGEWGLPRDRLGDLAEAYLSLVSLARRPTPNLTDREAQLLRSLARGWSLHDIGQSMYLSENAVRADIRAVAKRLGVANRVQVVARAIELGLLTLDGEE